MVFDILGYLLACRGFEDPEMISKNVAKRWCNSGLRIGDVCEQDNALDFGEGDKNVLVLRVVGIGGVGEGWEDRCDEERKYFLEAI